MTVSTATTRTPDGPPARHSAKRGGAARSTAAVFVGFISVVVLSLGTDQVLHVLEVYPPWGEPMWDRALNLLALSYRTL